MLTFKSISEGGVNLTVSRTEAAERLLRIVETQRDLKAEIDVSG